MKNLTPAKLVVMIMVAMGLLVAVYIGKQLMAKEPPPRTATRSVPLPVADLAPGTVIRDEHIGMGPWPIAEITGDTLLGRTAIVGRVVRKPLKTAELIRGGDLFPMGELPPLTVSDGHRAVTIRLKEEASIMNGLIRPGDHADVEFTPTKGTGDDRYQEIGGLSIRLFEGVRVLAINREFIQTDIQAGANTVTLEIAESDVALLRLADESGELYLSYTPEPSGVATIKVADPNRPTLEELLQLPPVPDEPPAPQQNVYRSWVYTGASRRTHTFVNGVPGDASYNYNRNPLAPPSSSPNGQPVYGQPGGYGAPAQGFQGAPAGSGFGPGGFPANGAAPFIGPQTGTSRSGSPGSRERGAPNSGFTPNARRTASNL